MITILELRPNPNSKSNGIEKYCNALRGLFYEDRDINILPVNNYPMKKGKILKERYEKGVLKNLLNNESIDIVHINGFASFSVIQSFWYARQSKKKILYTPHWHPFEFLNHPLRTKVFFYLLLKPLIRRCASTIITINNEDTSFFNKFHKKVIQIPHWIDKDTIIPVNKRKESNMVLFVGRVNEKNKGAEHLFQLPEGKYNIHCVGPCSGGLRSDMTSHVNIPFEELCELYAKASLLVVPSRYEAFSYAALEALSYNTPVLLSNRVRIADYLDGIKGVFVFNYHNYDDFCAKVHESIGSDVDEEKIFDVLGKDRVKKLYRNVFLSLGKE